MRREITGRHVLALFVGAFAVIVAVNLLLATMAIRTFPGLEVKSSYVASQTFDAERRAQEALGWSIVPGVTEETVTLAVLGPDGPVESRITEATLGRATHVAEDSVLAFRFDGARFVAPRPANLTSGHWNLRLAMTAPDGTPFRQRVTMWVEE